MVIGISAVQRQIYPLLKGRQLSSFKKQAAIFIFPNTSPADINFDCVKMKTLSKQGSNFTKLSSLSELGIRTLRGGKRRRPELSNLDSVSEKADRLFKNDRTCKIQLELTQKALDLLHLHVLSDDVHSALVLDMGCGSGISSAVIASRGHFPIGVDINPSVLKLLTEQSDYKTNAVQANINKEFPFRGSMFDIVVSISFLQWLIVDKDDDTLWRFFRSLKSCLTEKGTAVLQFYPRSLTDVEKTVQAACLFFKGFLVCDYPHKNRGKKLFIILFPL